ncbi:uncharacterized protein C8A04DRAFT_39124 [Dichotomopilus funicola]|uniref:DUF676 domain-containing protein n=1 Tax=Dichotomopilus funicola TaxID=1934379 RepID=A0AAN6UY62_9PEZI|nr:hypothetical protein C8A04DRAFT_39124 [Dichotomopilus funicola]
MASEKRVLLLVFIHGFKGTDFTFGDFPAHLKDTVANNLPNHEVTSVVYPQYETRGELAQSTTAFLEWLKERVMDLRKAHLDNPWPPNDHKVGVVLVAHSMGGFVATDTLFRVLDEHHQNHPPSPSPSTAPHTSTGNPPTSDPSTVTNPPIFPLIQGILAFDTPLNGLARSMFVYGAFSHYQKVSNVFNLMTALSAATPAALSRLASRRAIGSATGRIAKASQRSSPAWKAWQLVAMRTGTVGVIAAGGVAAFMHRKKIVEGVRSVRNLTREDVVAGYQQSVDALGQGLAYVNRGNVGESFAWLADHFTFVGALLKQNELNRRLERLAALQGGVGVCDVYASLGENGYWSGGYFVPERTFCAVPSGNKEEKKKASELAAEAKLFTRHVMSDAKDEIQAHTGLFKRPQNKNYERMTNDAAQRVVEWFNNTSPIYDDPRFQTPAPAEPAETEELAKAVDSEQGIEKAEESLAKTKSNEEGSADVDMPDNDDNNIPDESPIDIAAAASLVPLPDNIDKDLADDSTNTSTSNDNSQRTAYLRYLFGAAQQTSTSLRSYLPSGKIPSIPNVPVPSMPSMPSMPSVSMPKSINPWGGKKKEVSTEETGGTEEVGGGGPSEDAVQGEK